MNNRDASIAFANFGRFGARTLNKLRDYFGSPLELWQAAPTRLREIGLPEKGLAAFVAYRDRYDARIVAELLEQHKINIITQDDDQYPSLLREIADPPAILFVRGDIGNLALRPHVAVVGSRHCTEYGHQVAKIFTRRLAQAGAVVVSGLAYGIDEVAHRTTLETSGTTLAVLPSGVLGCDNSRQAQLVNAIIAGNGVVISEFPLRASPRKEHFPMRNRIVAGIAQATLVVEAAEKSGSLITARLALECNRDVFAVPGPITSATSAGTNRFIQDGAQVALTPDDVLRCLGLAESPSRERSINLNDLPPEQAAVLRILQAAPLHIDEIVRSTALATSTVNAVLTSLELRELIQPLGGLRYALAVQVQ